MKKELVSIFLILISLQAISQKKPTSAISVVSVPSMTPPKQGPKPFAEVITEKAVSSKGLFTVHKVEDKWYFEIPDSIINREVLTITRFTKTPSGGGSYGGELVNEQTIRWEKGPANNIFLRVVTVVSKASDSTQPIAQAVRNSNLDPIAQAFEIKAFGKDSTSVVIDVTDFFKGDNQPVSLNAGTKRRYNFGGIASDRSYIQSIRTYPINTEVKTVKTFTASSGGGSSIFSPFPSASLPGAEASGAITLELNNSFILLPKTPMRKRLQDSRVGFFGHSYVVYADNQQKAETLSFIHRWRLEPKDEDLEKWKRGELVEPKKPIIFYVDPATPKQWRPYLIAGVNDWQKSFEKAGFKNAILGMEWPAHDSTMSLEDARFSVIRYFASEIENAYGPDEVDPRSGEILESHIGWYHNVLKLLHDWYFIQASAVDPRARKMTFDEPLMGDLVRFVSSHEVGHTLGLQHNMGSSSRTSVEKLRDKAWVEAHGHTASIMDYARFNYVAQPEDNISPVGLYPRIGEYDEWAIKWGYKIIPDTKNETEENKILNKWIVDSLAANPRLWYSGGGNFDPRAQTEDLGDNSMKAGEYGIRNLKKILVSLPQWTKEEGNRYENLEEMYGALVSQFGRYMNHVAKNIGGIYEDLKSVEQTGNVYSPTPKQVQKQALDFLDKELFETPFWLLNKDILNKFSDPSSSESVASQQTGMVNSLLSSSRLFRMNACSMRFGPENTYRADELMEDLHKEIWKELSTKKIIDPFRRNLQKTHVEALINLINAPQMTIPPGIPRGFLIFFGGDIKNTDIPSIARAELVSVQRQVSTALPTIVDKLSRYHLQDVLERIKAALDPKQ